MVNLTIDNRNISVPEENTTIMDAAKMADSDSETLLFKRISTRLRPVVSVLLNSREREADHLLQ